MKQKDIAFGIVVILVVLTCSCTAKKAPVPDVVIPKSSMELPTQKVPDDIKKLEAVVKRAKSLSTEVVIAITILHHNNLKDLEEKMFDHNINATEKEKLFEARKNDFFNNLNFSYSEYTAYIANHSNEINAYIAQHPEIMDYLRTENRGEK